MSHEKSLYMYMRLLLSSTASILLYSPTINRSFTILTCVNYKYTQPRQVRGLARETDRIEITLVISCDNA